MANENDYDGGEIKILEGLEAVRKRPGMYIGSTSASGLHHLVWEIVDNSVDEAMAGFCTEIQVTVHADNSITVVDNGRGIPVDEHPVKKIPTLEVVMTILHAGGKFDNSAYKVSGGLHGVGISVVNALSKRVVVQVRRDGNTYEMEFSRGKTVKKMEVVGTSDSTGTTVTFWPDDEIFETCIYDFDTLHNRLQETAFLNKNLKIVLTDERESTPHVEEFCYEGGIIDFVKFLNEGKDVPEAFKEPIYIEGKSDPDAPVAKMGEVEVSLQWNSGYGENVMSFANDIYTPEGGMHLEGFRTALTRVINDYARKQNLLKEKDANLTGDDVREGLSAVISVKLPDPQFEGQTKAKLGSSYMRALTLKIVTDGLADYLEEHPKPAREIVKKAQQACKARNAARKAREALGDLGWAGQEFGKEVPETEFVGYDRTESEGTVVALAAEGEICGEVNEGMDAIVVLDRTPMYAEMGGQVADQGVMTADGVVFKVNNVLNNKGGKYMHYGKLLKGSIVLGDKLTVSIDTERRKAISRAHSATHLLQSALRLVLGDHVHQAGSLVEPDYLRFDFTHFSALTAEEIGQVNTVMADMILEGADIETQVMPFDEAKKLSAMALFGEKYGDTVRVVKMGDFSMEFCGGTHLDNTAKVGMFVITSEGSVASGVRRIEAITGREVIAKYIAMSGMINKVADRLKARPLEIMNKVESNLSEIHELRQNIDKLKDQLMSGQAERMLYGAKDIKGLKVITITNGPVNAADIRKMGDQLRDRYPNIVAVLAATAENKATMLAVCGKNAVARGVKAGDLIKSITKICEGTGGGKPDSAMGGCKNLLKLDDAMAAVDDFVNEHAQD